MVNCERGKVVIKGSLSEFLPEFLCLTRIIIQVIKENESEETIDFFKSDLNDAIAIGFGEKTFEECFTWDKE